MTALDNKDNQNNNDNKDKDKGDDHKDREIHVFINRKRFELKDPVQTGKALKELAGIPLTDVLFLRQPGKDAVIGNDEKVKLKDGDHLYSQPAADYGNASLQVSSVLDGLEGFTLQRQPDGWTFAIHDAYELPDAYLPRVVRLLVKLPPTFPDAAPDMFFVTPILRVMNGGPPRGTSATNILGQAWQQFSWHLKPGAWMPGVSTFRDFMRCVRSRLEKRD
ncbi:MAG: multiubiquitin domain-containing protein [Deltaproteobacteria bacterium]|nr:multiubiquitin domain-containing protein [Deltaproteobacteria bacterium]